MSVIDFLSLISIVLSISISLGVFAVLKTLRIIGSMECDISAMQEEQKMLEEAVVMLLDVRTIDIKLALEQMEKSDD